MSGENIDCSDHIRQRKADAYEKVCEVHPCGGAQKVYYTLAFLFLLIFVEKERTNERTKDHSDHFFK